MKNKINKMISLILLLSMLNGNILSMQKSNIEYKSQQAIEINQDVQQERGLLGLPAEVIEYILYQIIKPYENSIRNVNNILKFYSKLNSKLLKEGLIGVSLTSKNLRLWTLDLINRLKKLKENKYQDLVSPIKDQYQDLSKDELNSRLRNILNQLPINKDDLEKAAKLILASANVNETNNYGHTALMFAAMHGCKAIVQLLINKRANVNETNNYGATALMLAARWGYIGIVQLLISNGASVNGKDNDGYTALIWAAFNGYKDIAQLLIDNSANVNEENNYGDTALTWAARTGHKGTVQLLINNSANINEKSNLVKTALSWAARTGRKDIVQLLKTVKKKENYK